MEKKFLVKTGMKMVLLARLDETPLAQIKENKMKKKDEKKKSERIIN